MKRWEVDRELSRLAGEIKRVWGGQHVELQQAFNGRGSAVYNEDGKPLVTYRAVIRNPGDHETSVDGYRTRLGAMRALLRRAKEEMGVS